jgi:very-short-patch-repair endonuclease
MKGRDRASGRLSFAVRKEVARERRDALIARIASNQHGVISAVQLRSAGFSPAAMTRLNGRVLHRIHRGVYAIGHRGLSNEGRWMAAVLACGDGALLSHMSAAALWGIGPRNRWHGLVDISVPGRAGRASRPGIRLHRPESLPPSDCTRRDAIPVTTAIRTLADLRPLLSPARFSSAVREAQFRRLPIGDQGRADGARSELEARMLALCRRHRLPQPEVNVSIDRYVVDFLWADRCLIVEVDGWESHRTRWAVEEDRARDARLAVLGYETVRFTWRQVTDDARGVARTIRSLLRARVEKTDRASSFRPAEGTRPNRL